MTNILSLKTVEKTRTAISCSIPYNATCVSTSTDAFGSSLTDIYYFLDLDRLVLVTLYA